jgi:hypothetical protein
MGKSARGPWGENDQKREIFGCPKRAESGSQRDGDGIALSLAHGLQFDAGKDPLQLGGRNHHMLAIRGARWALEAASLEALHPNGDAIGVPVQELDSIASMVQEHEQAAFAHIAPKIVLDDSEEAIETLAHVDGFGMQVDGDRGAQSQHDAMRCA